MSLARWPSLSSCLPDRRPGVSRSTMNAAMPLCRERGIVGREDDVEARVAGVGDPALLPVEHVVVAVLREARLEPGDVAARRRARWSRSSP